MALQIRNINDLTNVPRNARGGYYLDGADLNGAQLQNAILFYSTTIINSELNYIDLTNSELFDSDLSNSTLIGATLINTLFMNSNLTNVNFTDANCSRADFTGAILTEVDFTYADLSNCEFVNAKYIENIKSVRGAILDGIEPVEIREQLIEMKNLQESGPILKGGKKRKYKSKRKKTKRRTNKPRNKRINRRTYKK
jgi:uncharacterized protein YjbI with pentapeptide repeats